MRRMALLLACVAVILGACKAKKSETGPAEVIPLVDEKTGDRVKPGPVPESAPPPGPLVGRETVGGEGRERAQKLNTKGLTKLRKNLLDGARESFEKALEEDPEHAAAAYNLACTLSLQGETAGAADMIARALVQGCPRFCPKLAEDPDLEKLRQSKDWTRVEEASKTYEEAWSRALASPGVFVLVGVRQTLKDPSGEVLGDDLERGEILFYHVESGRFLDLGMGRNLSGFLADRATGAVHAVGWNRQVIEMDTIPTQWSGVSVTSLALEGFRESEVKVKGAVTGIVLYVQEGKPVLRYAWFDEAEADEIWEHASVEGDGLKRITTTPAAVTPIDMSDGEWKGGAKHCEKRLGTPVPVESYIFLDVFCAGERPGMAAGCVPAGGGWLACVDAREAPEKLVLKQGDGPERVVLETERIIQIGAL